MNKASRLQHSSQGTNETELIGKATWPTSTKYGNDLRKRPSDADKIFIRARATYLHIDERGLLQRLVRDDWTCKKAADDLNVSPRMIRRKVRNAITRMKTPMFEFCVFYTGWPPQRLLVARLCFCEGRTIEDIERETGRTRYWVRKHIKAINEEYKKCKV